jgi:Zn-dependent protease
LADGYRHVKLSIVFGVPLRVDARGALGGLALNAALLAIVARLWTRGADPLELAGLGLAAALLLQLSALAHEYAHALTARLLGQRVDYVALTLIGGCAWVDLDAASRRSAAAIVAAGPAASLALALCAWAAAPIAPLLGVVAAMNALLLALNMVPLAALDGGRLVALVRGTPNRAQVAHQEPSGRVPSGVLVDPRGAF